MNACNNNNIKPEEITVDDETKIDNIYIYTYYIFKYNYKKKIQIKQKQNDKKTRKTKRMVVIFVIK